MEGPINIEHVEVTDSIGLTPGIPLHKQNPLAIEYQLSSHALPGTPFVQYLVSDFERLRMDAILVIIGGVLDRDIEVRILAVVLFQKGQYPLTQRQTPLGRMRTVECQRKIGVVSPPRAMQRALPRAS